MLLVVFVQFFLNTNGSAADLKFNNTSRNEWKLLFVVKYNWNSTKTIRLFALDFYEVMSPHRNLELIMLLLIDVNLRVGTKRVAFNLNPLLNPL